MQILRQRRKLGTEVEQLMLDPVQDIHQLAEPQGARGFLGACYAGQPDEGIQLVDGSVGLDARGIFRDSLPACQASIAFIATLGVDPVERNPRLIESFLWGSPFVHAFMLPALGWGVLNAVSPVSWFILLAAATAAGIANALAGGGTFLIFPALVFAGVDPIMANATSSVITLPGGVASALVYRRPVTGKLF